MTDKKTEALKLALEALENTTPTGFNMESDKRFFAAITALREALAEQQAPSGGQQDDLILALYSKIDFLREKIELLESGLVQAKRTWQGLTDEDIEELAKWADKNGAPWHLEFARAIEAKLKAKNSL